jgi:hypothetical protein
VQVTINCAERGLLLLRVRDEIRMTIAAYQTLCVPFRREHLNVVKKYFLEPLLMMQLCGGRCYSARCMAVALAACTCCADAIQWRVVLMVFSEVYSGRGGLTGLTNRAIYIYNSKFHNNNNNNNNNNNITLAQCLQTDTCVVLIKFAGSKNI